MRETIDWVALYDYPSHLSQLKAGDVGVFVCPAAWRGRLGTVCGIWIKSNTDWASHFPPGTPWPKVFWTEADAEGLRVGRAPLPARPGHEFPKRFRCLPRREIRSPGTDDLQRILAGWSMKRGEGGSSTSRRGLAA